MVITLSRQTTKSRRGVRPTTLVVWCYVALITAGTVLLMLPISAANSHPTGQCAPSPGDMCLPTALSDALFTATSATSLTGLITVDTATHWSTFGKVVIMLLIQLGGLGFMTLASLFGLFVAGRLGLNRRAGARVEGRGMDMGEISWVVRAAVSFTLLVEFVVAVALTLRFHSGYGYGWGRSAWEGLFHAISGFNNAGFALYTDNVMGFFSDAWVLLPLAFALIVGGLGFPVLLEAWRHLKAWLSVRTRGQLPKRWSLTTRFTIKGTILLIALGTLMVAFGEWSNAMSGFTTGEKVLNSFFAGVSPRTAGFNALDYADFHPSTLLGTDFLMFIGGGTGGTAGGVKITTSAVILAAVLAEIRGDTSVSVARRRLNPKVLRQALVVLAFGIGQVFLAVIAVSFLAPQFSTDQILFEVVSAFATVGLSTGITADLPVAAQAIFIVLMFTGRVGPIALATALAARPRQRVYEYPEERPFIG